MSLPASELGLFTPSLSIKLPRWDAKRWPPAPVAVCQDRLHLSLRCIPPDSLRSDSCVSRAASLRYFHLVPGCNHTASCSRARCCWLESIWRLGGKTIEGDKIFTPGLWKIRRGNPKALATATNVDTDSVSQMLSALDKFFLLLLFKKIKFSPRARFCQNEPQESSWRV